MSVDRPRRLSRILIQALRLTEARQIIRAQQDLLQLEYDHVEALRRELVDCELGYSRITRDFIVNFLVALDMPERHDQIRTDLHASLTDLNDQVARLEEMTR